MNNVNCFVGRRHLGRNPVLSLKERDRAYVAREIMLRRTQIQLLSHDCFVGRTASEIRFDSSNLVRERSNEMGVEDGRWTDQEHPRHSYVL